MLRQLEQIFNMRGSFICSASLDPVKGILLHICVHPDQLLVQLPMSQRDTPRQVSNVLWTAAAFGGNGVQPLVCLAVACGDDDALIELALAVARIVHLLKQAVQDLNTWRSLRAMSTVRSNRCIRCSIVSSAATSC